MLGGFLRCTFLSVGDVEGQRYNGDFVGAWDGFTVALQIGVGVGDGVGFSVRSGAALGRLDLIFKGFPVVGCVEGMREGQL
jgi:hypothetical protein